MAELPINLLPDEASPAWMNKGDSAWQLTEATRVGLQSVPGLVILYGSIVKKKWAVNYAFMALYAFASVLVCWVGWGYQMSFGDKMIPFLGRPDVSLDQKFLLDQAFLGYLPNATMVSFQFVFAAITLSLGGTGGTKDRERFPPNNIILMLAGAGLLWMGWSGFNGGDPYTVSTDTSLAVLNTHVCTATSLLTWLLLDILFFGKPSVIGDTFVIWKNLLKGQL